MIDPKRWTSHNRRIVESDIRPPTIGRPAAAGLRLCNRRRDVVDDLTDLLLANIWTRDGTTPPLRGCYSVLSTSCLFPRTTQYHPSISLGAPILSRSRAFTFSGPFKSHYVIHWLVKLALSGVNSPRNKNCANEWGVSRDEENARVILIRKNMDLGKMKGGHSHECW